MKLKPSWAIAQLLCCCVLVSASNCNEDWAAQEQLIRNQLDLSVEPCDDFYEYACGNWRMPYKLRTLGARDSLTAAKAANKLLLMQYFEKDTPKNLTMPQMSAVRFYNSCMDDCIRTEKSDGIGVYAEVFKQISGWSAMPPHFADAESTNVSFNWEHVSAQFQLFGINTFWQLLVQPNWQLAEQNIFYIMAPSFELLKHSKLADSYDDDSVFLYHRYIKYLMLDLGVRVRMANRIADEVVEFEKQLIGLTSENSYVLLHAPLTLDNLAAQLRDVKLLQYFETILDGLEPPANYTSQLLVVADISYLRKLSEFLQCAKLETVGKYLLVQFLAHFEVHMHEEDTFNEQKEHCLQQVNHFLPDELSEIFLQLQYGNSAEFLRDTQVQLDQIFLKLKVQFERMLNATNIFERDAVTRILGLEKLRAMRLLLPQPRPSHNAAELGESYDRNLMTLYKLQTQRELVEVLSSINLVTGSELRTPKSYGPLDVNAYYRLTKNAIEIPVGLLRQPFFEKCLPASRIYGSFVYILAHEFLHGFDYDGLNYDKTGNVGSGWGPKAVIKLGTKSGCYLTDRYKNGPLNINENIADSEGLRLAFETFRSDLVESSSATTESKQFFISFAQTWCGASGASRHSLHAGHRERVNNVLGNFVEFADIFHCRKGSPMNPEEKCRIW